MAPKIDKGFDPIQAKHRENMQAVFGALCDALPGLGMCLFVFDEHAGQPRSNYISNCDRKQTLSAVKQWVACQESETAPPAADVRALLTPSRTLPAEMTPAIQDLLGMPNFVCGPIAHAFRDFGHTIPSKSEAEQAFILFRFLPYAIEFGDDWREHAQGDVNRSKAEAADRKASLGIAPQDEG